MWCWRGWLGVAVLVSWMMQAATTPVRAAVAVGQTDDFEDGTTLNWRGATGPLAPANVASGGPSGADDNFLRLTSSGASTAGGKLVAFNFDQWAGNYLAAGINAIEMQVNNLGATDLTLRLILRDDADLQSLSTVADVDVPAGSGWTTVSFPLTAANLTGPAGSTFETVMGSVTELNLVHNDTPIPHRQNAENIAALLGVDNIRAVGVPEPACLSAIVLTVGAVMQRCRAR